VIEIMLVGVAKRRGLLVACAAQVDMDDVEDERKGKTFTVLS
jgi:hypothetical protein